ncbi:MAG: ABC transporter, partial [Chloroflexota bacterium]
MAASFGSHLRARQPFQHRQRVGYLPGELNLYDGLTGWELFRFFGRLRGKLDTAYLKQLLERFDLDPTRKLRTL